MIHTQEELEAIIAARVEANKKVDLNDLADLLVAKGVVSEAEKDGTKKKK